MLNKPQEQATGTAGADAVIKQGQEGTMDKYFLLTYTKLGYDGFWHSYYAWFVTEEELRRFVEKAGRIEIDLAVEILSCRKIEWEKSMAGEK